MKVLTNKPLVTYVFLVGLPLVGLLGVLHVGRGLQAPPLVDGTWRTISAEAAPASAAASLRPAGGDPTQLEVQQSGTYLSLDIGPLHLSGRLQGDSLVARSGASAAPRDGGCSHEGAMELRARLDRAAEPHRLTAVLSEPGRPACPPVRWTAVHLAQDAGSGGKGGH